MKYLIIAFITLFTGCISSPSTVDLPDYEPSKKVLNMEKSSLHEFPIKREVLEYKEKTSNPTIWTNYNYKTDLLVEYLVEVNGVYIAGDLEAFEMSINVVIADTELLAELYPGYTRIVVRITRYEYK